MRHPYNYKKDAKFYNSRTWRNKRKSILQRDNYECQHCKDKGGYTKAHTVHHIKELAYYPELALADTNLVALCFSCHERIHERGKKEVVEVNEERW